MPRFCRTIPCNRLIFTKKLIRFNKFYPFVIFSKDNGKEILSPCEVLKYFLASNVPVIDKEILPELKYMKDYDWQRYVQEIQGTLVTYPGKVKFFNIAFFKNCFLNE